MTGFTVTLWLLAAVFAVAFSVVVVPALLVDGDLWGAVAAGFANPYAAGYALDAIGCWCVLAAWVLHERRTVRHGWVALLLGLVPGAVVGFAAYLLIRRRTYRAVNQRASSLEGGFP